MAYETVKQSLAITNFTMIYINITQTHTQILKYFWILYLKVYFKYTELIKNGKRHLIVSDTYWFILF